MASLTSEEAALTALQGALALAHGFVLLELYGQLRRGGDLDAAFRGSGAGLSAGLALLGTG